MIPQNSIVDISSIKFIPNGKKFKGEKTGEKWCNKCKQMKLLSEFGNNTKYFDGKNYGKCYMCKKCRSIETKNIYAKKIGKSRDQIEKVHKDRIVNNTIINGKRLCSYCKQLKSVNCFIKNKVYTCGLGSVCQSCQKWYARIKSRILKMEFIIAYGGYCQCCGEDKIELLTVEHIRNNGHNLIYDSNIIQLILILKVKGWPEGYTVLCYNCNLSSKGDRPCCHTEEYKTYEQKFNTALINGKKQNLYNELKNKLDIMNGKVPAVKLVSK